MVIRTVLCPLDFSALSIGELELAVGLCRASGARLVLHHNLSDAGPGAGMRWMWLQERNGLIPNADPEILLRDLLASLPDDLEAEAVITRGLAAPAILAVQERLRADLLLLGTHGATSDEHASVTERVVLESKRPVLVLHEGRLDGSISFAPPGLDRPWSVLVPTDLTADSEACVRYAMELAATWSVRVDLLHVVETAYPGPHGDARLRIEESVGRRLMELVPEELERVVDCHVRFGDPTTEIATAADILDPQAIVIGNHARGPLRRFFTRDTSRGVLHGTHHPTWIVPARWAA